MHIHIDTNKLKAIAQAAVVQNETNQLDHDRLESLKKKQEIEQIKKTAEEIIASIPAALEEAAKNPGKTSDGNLIVAKIPIVREHMTSIMDTKGSLSSKDKAILIAVVKELQNIIIPEGVDAIRVSQETKLFTKSDSTDNAIGPCICYFLTVYVTVPK